MARAVDDVPRLRPERVPPQNLEAEQSVLGSMMLSSEAIADVVELLHPEDFYRSAHRTLFETMRAIYARGDPVDIITTTEELKRSGVLEDIGGPLYVRDLSEQVPTPAGAGHYAKIVSQAALLRRLINAAADIMQIGYSSPEDPEAAADDAEQRIYEVARREDRDQVAQVKDLIDEAMVTLESIQNSEAQYEGLPTGFRDLDGLMSGMQSGNLIVVAARPGVGKSSFVTNLARNVAVDAREPVGLFSLEMSRWEIGMRLLCGEARVPWDRIRNKRVGAEDWSNIVQAAEKLHDAPLSIVDSGNVTIVDIRARARRLATRQQGLSVIIVDYLQLMSHHRRVDNRQQEIAEISRSLKLLAKELGIPVIAVSQLNRDPERAPGQAPAALRPARVGRDRAGRRRRHVHPQGRHGRLDEGDRRSHRGQASKRSDGHRQARLPPQPHPVPQLRAGANRPRARSVTPASGRLPISKGPPTAYRPSPEERRRVRAIHRRLKKRFGALDPPRRTDPLDELILTVLSQNTSDVNSFRAFESLRSRYPTWDRVARARASSVATAIRPGGLANVKAPRILAILREIGRPYDLSWMRAATDAEDPRVPSRPSGRGTQDRGGAFSRSHSRGRRFRSIRTCSARRRGWGSSPRRRLPTRRTTCSRPSCHPSCEWRCTSG